MTARADDTWYGWAESWYACVFGEVRQSDYEVVAPNAGSAAAPTFGNVSTVGVCAEHNEAHRRYMENAYAIVNGLGGELDTLFVGVYDGHGGVQCADATSEQLHTLLSQAMADNLPYGGVVEYSRTHPVTLGREAEADPAMVGLAFDDDDEEEEEEAASAGAAAGGHLAAELDADGSLKKRPPPEPLPLPSDAVLRAFVEAFHGTDRYIADKGLGEECGTAGAACIIVGGGEGGGDRSIYAANVGDCRVVVSDQGQAVRMTRDFKPNDKDELRRIKKQGGFVFRGRTLGFLNLSRALGHTSLKEYILGTPKTSSMRLGVGCTWVVVACDGLWGYMSDQEVVDFVEREHAADRSLTGDDMSRLLVEQALLHRSRDNITVVCVQL